MTSAEIANSWKQSFGDFAPVGFVCRERLRPRWLRIHSLPGSKRYPDTDADYVELLRRHNEAATAVLGEHEECVLFAGTYAHDLPVIEGISFVAVPELSIDDMTFAAAPCSWKRTRFDSLIAAVADERAGPVLFANFSRRSAYAPYDGGADLFLDSAERVLPLKTKWSAWLSPRNDEL